MSNKFYRIGDFAKLTGVTERTLRYYDRQGLLSPSKRNEHGHRFYTEQDLLQLQKILTLKYLDFSLEDILGNLKKNDENFQQTLHMQYELLKQKQEQLNRVLTTLDRMKQLYGDGEQPVIDRDLLIFYIHNVRNEQQQKEWIAQHLPDFNYEMFFLDNRPLEERVNIEKRITFLVMELKALYKQNKKSEDEEVQKFAKQFLLVIEEIIGPLKNIFTPESIQQLEQIDTEVADVLFPSGLTKDEEAFLLEVLGKLEEFQEFKVGMSDEAQ